MKAILGLALLLGAVTLSLGCFGIQVISPWEVYEDETGPLLKHYKETVAEWQRVASDSKEFTSLHLHADDAAGKMAIIVREWDKIEPPEAAEQYHLWVRHAMDYEREAFEVLGRYYRLDEWSSAEEARDMRDMATRLWILKDEALLKADAALSE